MRKFIEVRGAAEHNLKDINLDIPLNKFIVVSGVSGSGKSSLAFDTLYAEGQRRYMESLSSYARQFLGQMKKPAVESITGIPPAVAIKQKGPGYNPRSTVGTLTEINDFLRLLYARVGIPHCPKCGRQIKSSSTGEIINSLLKNFKGMSVSINAPLVKERKGAYRELLERLRGEGFISVMIDGKLYSLEEEIQLDAKKSHTISVAVDKLKVEDNPDDLERLTDSVEIGLKRSGGVIEILPEKGETVVYSTHYSCPNCDISLGELEPRSFSFNSPFGACPLCSGLGISLDIDEDLVIPDSSLTINEGAIEPWSYPITNLQERWKNSARKYRMQHIITLAEEVGFDLDTPFKKLPLKARKMLVYGSEKEYDFTLKKAGRVYKKRAYFEGVIPELKRRHLQTDSDFVREKIQSDYMREKPCSACGGRRLKPETLAVTLGKKNIAELSEMSAGPLKEFLKNLKFTEFEQEVSKRIMRELDERLGFLIDVGVDYISLDRSAVTLSSGESERIRLATQIGSSLVGVAYILDEPTVGLHARDTERLLKSLRSLQKLGNTLIAVEHDPATIDEADFVIDLGPGAGSQGGEIVYIGPSNKFSACKKSLTAGYHSGRLKVPYPKKFRQASKKKIKLTGCSQFNLKNISVEFPLGLISCVTGVSGSGKSTLVEDILFKALWKKLNPRSEVYPGKFKKISGYEDIGRVINIDQTPIGRTPRSNPATYTGVFTPLRDLFASLPLSRARGYSAGRFSFNVKEGTCQRCSGQGLVKLEMHFLPDIYVTCDVCNGKKYTEATLDIKYRGKSIYDVLEMTVDEAAEFFSKIPKIIRPLNTMKSVGLGYLKLGQPSTTLSGGEAQRIKLARELAKLNQGNTLYILDEPTTGLHSHDIVYLLKVLHQLADKGNTIVVIEHNLDVIKNADWIVDLGPEGGPEGGNLLVCGKPSNLIKSQVGYTGKFLKEYLENEKKITTN
ncbi:MAG: excinuclease ABC subunit UvrA [Elusimicrobia bacterium]|nr:excinuclease ABC subunit UvrA [Elusimicrobiota bacterium]